MKATLITIIIWALIVIFGAVCFHKIDKLNQSLERAIANTNESMKQTSECLKAGFELKNLYIEVVHQRDSLQEIVNNQNQKP